MSEGVQELVEVLLHHLHTPWLPLEQLHDSHDPWQAKNQPLVA